MLSSVTPIISVAPNVSPPQRSPVQGFPQGPQPQGPHQVPHHQQERPLYGSTPPWTYGYNGYNTYTQPPFILQGPYAHQAPPMMDPNYMQAMMTEMLNEYKEQEIVSTYITGKPYPSHMNAVPFSPKFV